MLVRDELEVDEVNSRPYLPRSLASSEEIALDLVSDGAEGVTADKSKIGEEYGHEKWTPHGLVNKNLFGDGSSILSWDLTVEPVVEVVTGRSVVQKTEGGESDESLDVESTSGDKDLFVGWVWMIEIVDSKTEVEFVRFP